MDSKITTNNTMNPQQILIILSLIFTVLSMAWPRPYLLPVAVLLIAIALLIK